MDEVQRLDRMCTYLFPLPLFRNSVWPSGPVCWTSFTSLSRGSSRLRISATLLLSLLISLTRWPSAIPTSKKDTGKQQHTEANSSALSVWGFLFSFVCRLLTIHRVKSQSKSQSLNEGVLNTWSVMGPSVLLHSALPSLLHSFTHSAESWF